MYIQYSTCRVVKKGDSFDGFSISPQGIHGDEVVGRELVLYLARALCQQFNSDSSITELLSTTEIHLMPSLNTDGYILKTRNNANDKVTHYTT